MDELVFRLRRVVEKPKKRLGKRGSMYDPILDRFIEGEHGLVKVRVENRKSDYVRVQLVRLIEERGLEDQLKASVVDSVLYLEKV